MDCETVCYQAFPKTLLFLYPSTKHLKCCWSARYSKLLQHGDMVTSHKGADCRGCSASDPLDGVLTPYVQACSTTTARSALLLLLQSSCIWYYEALLPGIRRVTCETSVDRTTLSVHIHCDQTCSIFVKLVCSVTWLMSCRSLFTTTGISACSYNMNVAGVYTITFAVTNSQGLSASVNRTLVVMPTCPAGQTLCSNKVKLLLR